MASRLCVGLTAAAIRAFWAAAAAAVAGAGVRCTAAGVGAGRAGAGGTGLTFGTGGRLTVAVVAGLGAIRAVWTGAGATGLTLGVAVRVTLAVAAGATFFLLVCAWAGRFTAALPNINTPTATIKMILFIISSFFCFESFGIAARLCNAHLQERGSREDLRKKMIFLG